MEYNVFLDASKGVRDCSVFNRRLRRAFPEFEIRVVWSGRLESWMVLQRGAKTNRWIHLTLWNHEPAEDLITALHAGRINGQRIKNPVTHMDKVLRQQEIKRQRDIQHAQYERREMQKDTSYYLPAIMDAKYQQRDVIVLPEKWTHGWRAEN